VDAAWLASVDERSCALVLQGPPGIGKSYRLDATLAQARSAGWQVLRAQPAQAETRLIGSALIDLCDEVTDEEIAELPSVQAAGLSAALLRGDRPGGEVNPHAVLLAFTSLLRRFAARRRVLIAVDDLQWLDSQTASALAFAARRLPTAGVGLLLGRRTEPGVDEPELIADLEAALPLVRHTLEPLHRDELLSVLRERVSDLLPAGVLRAALDAAGGNPLFGIEVARALLAGAGDRARDGIPLPDSLTELVGRHVDALPESTRLSLAACSALRRPTVHQLRGLGMTDQLAPAERAGLVRVDGHDVTFTHPLYAAAAYQSLAGTERMQLHARLAGVVDGLEERARHLALGAEQPAESVAEALDVARDCALQRGAVEAAVDACRLGLRATPEGSPARAGRQIHFGRLLFRVGESTVAKHELAAAAEHATDPVQRAHALHELANVVGDTESELQAVQLERQALELAGDDVELRAAIHTGIALRDSQDWVRSVEHARTAIALLQDRPDVDPSKLAAALTSLVGASLYAGLGADVDACKRAIELEGDAVSAPVSDRALSVLFYLQFWIDDYAGARAQMAYAYQLAQDEGDEASRAYILSMMGELEVRAARWDRAARYLDECEELCDRIQNVYFGRLARHRRAWVQAFRGELEPATRMAEAEVGAGAASGNRLQEIRGLALLGFCSAMRGDMATAAELFDRYTAVFAEQHAHEPALRIMAGDHVEALVAVGRLADAREALAAMVEPALRLERTAVLAAGARAEAVLLAAEGDGEAAVAAAQRSLDLYDELDRPLDRARSLLVKGQIHRRCKQKSLARRELTAAADAFAALGADPFAARAQDELRRVGLRPKATDELTETEQRIAELTATGMRSAEVASTLFLSTKTVSGNLTRIYRKLGVRNRAELAGYLAQQSNPDIASN
jgi:DNA-binding CsgD family transcriptional regulator/tetratricopeptide (TPR) repeat protein